MLSTSIAADSSFVYWLDRFTISRAPVGGGPVTMIANAAAAYPPDAAPRLGSLAVGSSLVYWTEAWGDWDAPPVASGIRSAPVDAVDAGGSVVVKGLSARGLGIAVDRSSIYWIDLSGAVWKATLSGGRPVQLASGPIMAFTIAIDGTNVYWLAGDDSDGSLLSVPLVGGPVMVRAQGISAAGQVAIDDDSIYFTSRFNVITDVPPDGAPDTGKIWRVAK
jgi:hypothetical protein